MGRPNSTGLQPLPPRNNRPHGDPKSSSLLILYSIVNILRQVFSLPSGFCLPVSLHPQ